MYNTLKEACFTLEIKSITFNCGSQHEKVRKSYVSVIHIVTPICSKQKDTDKYLLEEIETYFYWEHTEVFFMHV